MASSQPYKTLQDFGHILSLFNALQADELGVTEISKQLRMHPSKVSRILGTMEASGLFEQNIITRKYRIGIAFFDFGMFYLRNMPLRKIIRPHIEEMAKTQNAIAIWAILHSNKCYVMDSLRKLSANLATHRIEANLPITSSCLGKCLLAFLSEEARGKLLSSIKMEVLTKSTIVDSKLLRRECENSRKQGYATERGETIEHFNGIAAPIKDSHGQVVATVGLLGYDWDIPADKLFSNADYLRKKAFFISRQIGYDGSTWWER